MLSWAKRVPPNQARRLRNLQYSSFCVSGSPCFVTQLWGGCIIRYSMAVLVPVGSNVINFRGIHGS